MEYVRKIFIVPKDLDPEVVSSIDRVIFMPGTIEIDNQAILDMVDNGTFTTPEGWQCIYDGSSLDMDALYPFLAPIRVYDDEGNVTGTLPAERKVPHNWAGFDQIIVS